MEVKVYKISSKNALKLVSANLKNKAKELLETIEENPYKVPPPYEKLQGDLNGFISRRINRQHRLIYKVYEKEKIIKVIRMWTHYE